MYLKQLESVGFKSFAERIRIEFVQGVTAVVGPNGSGKSNIIDAIRWVLGEQSAKSLRGTKMEDIIFQGSDTRKALNVAEVTLTLDNQDGKLPVEYNEVTVTRRVYRSGESEFYLNKQACRLKDIIDLFIDSGLGKEAFSIISQGKVEEILSSKAEDRRIIFEEAAGVLKYKQRKRKAVLKLAETEDNLSRIEDIVYEIEQQTTPLKEQAEKAKLYKQRKKALKEQEISLLITEIEQLHAEWQDLLLKVEAEKDAEINWKTTIQLEQTAMEREQQQQKKLDARIEVLQGDLLLKTRQLEKLEAEKRVYFERSTHQTEIKENLIQQIQKYKESIELEAAQLVIEAEKLILLETEQEETILEIAKLRKALEPSDMGRINQVEQLQADYIENLNKQAANKNELQSVQQQIKQVLNKQHENTPKYETARQEQDKFVAAEAIVKNNLMEKEAALRKQVHKVDKLKQAIAQSEAKVAEYRKLVQAADQQCTRVQARIDTMEEMKAAFQGFFHGVKAVLGARDNEKLTNIHGAVIELITTPEKYMQAIETVLGAGAQHIITADEQAARAAIAWLKQTNSGRATFLPLESIESRKIDPATVAKLTTHAGFIGVAKDLVQADAKYNPAIEYLMGNVIIASTLKAANELAKLTKRKIRVVTLEGDVVNPGGSMSGGASKQASQSLFTREKDLIKLHEQLIVVEKQRVDLLNKETLETDQLAVLFKELKAEELVLSVSNEAIHTHQAKHREIAMKLLSMDEKLESYHVEQTGYESEVVALLARETEVGNSLKELTANATDLDTEINLLSAKANTFKENKAQFTDALHRFQIHLAKQEEQIKNQQTGIEQIDVKLVELEQQHKACIDQKEALVLAANNQEISMQLDGKISENQAEIARITEEIQTKRATRLLKTQQMEDKEREIKAETKEHASALKRLQANEIKAARLDVELENYLTHLQTEYRITFEKARKDYPFCVDTEKSKHSVVVLKQQIEQLGVVNIGAIEEYDRLKERHTFLMVQKTDLLEAKQTLYEIIEEMDAEMGKLFSETFMQIKTEFVQVFQELFDGGYAELALTDPLNILDTGVEIIAQPPGKKLKNLSLLSGGERALTAIALLFAILRVRPVPFCILDEVEAALDEANVVRFAKYVRKYSVKTQFIVITHRKGTMEEADVLYGVTMEESGVSRLVSVHLEDTLETIHS